MRDVFLSYSHRNQRIVERIANDLRNQGIDVWLDTIEIEVGDLVHRRIEDAIEECRYFCIAWSPSAARSYYVRDVEFEEAFTRLVREQRDSFVLPIVVRPLNEPMPTRLAGRHYLDFTKPNLYNRNIRKLAKRILLLDEKYSGQRWYKGLEISSYGDPTGLGEVAQKAPTGGSYCLFYEDGVVQRVDVYQNGDLVNYKEFGRDEKGRVVENRMYSPDGRGGWHIDAEIWYYDYHPTTGMRMRKFMQRPGAHSAREQRYDNGRLVEELVVTDDGSQDLSYGFARKEFSYSPEGHKVREVWYDYDGQVIRDVET